MLGKKKKKKVVYELRLNVLLIFFLHHDVFCNLLGYRPMATWNLFVLYDRKKQILFMVMSSLHLSSNRS